MALEAQLPAQGSMYSALHQRRKHQEGEFEEYWTNSVRQVKRTDTLVLRVAADGAGISGGGGIADETAREDGTWG
jgi:hypothetical protein